ncbi:MAG: porphobilinogen synthase [Candidatus Paracaedibacteraceae bacterium]|nr:porphobilinogen synthase [Candidatus Paracaedibacteraceae bacterium]
MTWGTYPNTRLRRLRQAAWIRDLCAENDLTPRDLIWPIFVRDENTPSLISSMPGVNRLTLEELTEAVQQATDVGIPAIALFPTTPSRLRSPDGSEALNPNNLICQAVRAIKSLNLNIGVITDVALDPYTDHGHDGIIINGVLDNDATIEVLEQQSYIQAQAGADALAPSDMMDGRIAAIRDYLDDHGHKDRLLISYAAKYASSFYGPFRQAVGNPTLSNLKDKKTYQLNPANSDEAMREIAQDIQEGADMIIVKPGMPYLDIIQRASTQFNIPTLAYQISGEYAMLKAAIQNGWLDGDRAILESLMGFKRAGAKGILTYFAFDVAKKLCE